MSTEDPTNELDFQDEPDLDEHEPGFPLNRLVVLFSPIFVALAGWVCDWMAKNFPGLPAFNKAELTAIFIAGATYAAVHVGQWLHGWQKWEQHLAIKDENASADVPILEPPAPHEIDEHPDGLDYQQDQFDDSGQPVAPPGV